MEYVSKLLQDKGIQYKEAAKDYVILCLNPDHDDKSPSMRVDKVSGIMHCFSCGFSGNLFKYYGLVSNNVSVRVSKAKQKIRDLLEQARGIEFPETIVPMHKVFRGISVETFKHFEAFYTTSQREEFADRIFFPIYDVSKKPRAYIGRHMLSSGNPRYFIYPSGANLPLYPEVLTEPSSSIVVVEGIFDLLNCWDKGLKNTVCMFGVASLYKDAAKKLLPFKIQGVTKIYLMLDGDKAGTEASKKLKPIIEEAEFQCEILALPEDSDPGELDQENITSIREYIHEKDRSNY